jgi:NAD+ diphosphatase
MLNPSIINPFCGDPIDRQSIRRGDADWIGRSMEAGPARFLTVSDGHVAVAGPSGSPCLDWRDRPPAGSLETIFLGVRQEVAHYACVVVPACEGLVELRTVAPELPLAEASLAAYAVGLARWHGRHRFCGVCGHPTLVAEAGHRRTCTNLACGADHFPRTDPAIIVLVEFGDRCFLARNAKYRPGMHSTLAGFVEPGETLEAAVHREVWEEAGIHLARMSYHSSQPWPFPASLMLGYHAEAQSDSFEVDGREIVSGAWFTRDQLRPFLAPVAGSEAFNLPGPLSISRRLIEDWVNHRHRDP